MMENIVATFIDSCRRSCLSQQKLSELIAIALNSEVKSSACCFAISLVVYFAAVLDKQLGALDLNVF